MELGVTEERILQNYPNEGPGKKHSIPRTSVTAGSTSKGKGGAVTPIENDSEAGVTDFRHFRGGGRCCPNFRSVGIELAARERPFGSPFKSSLCITSYYY